MDNQKYMDILRRRMNFLEQDEKAKEFADRLWDILMDHRSHDRSCVFHSHTVKGSCDCDSGIDYENILDAFADTMLGITEEENALPQTR